MSSHCFTFLNMFSLWRRLGGTAVNINRIKTQIWTLGTSPAVQWLGLGALTAEGAGSIPGQGTKIPQAVRPKKKKKSLHSHKPSCHGKRFVMNKKTPISKKKKKNLNLGKDSEDETNMGPITVFGTLPWNERILIRGLVVEKDAHVGEISTHGRHP